MNRTLQAALLAGAIALAPSNGAAQTFEVLGTRAAGMAGAFVAVTNDASAVYWNPGALASGSYFSLLVDRTSGESSKDDDPTFGAGSTSGTTIAVAALPLGLSYYRLRATTLHPATGTDMVRADSLITHHAGATLVQSITRQISVGATLKLVRGIAASGVTSTSGRDLDGLLDEAGDLVGHATNRFDADVGVFAGVGTLRAGFTFRNVTEPKFDTVDGIELRLERQARAGIALVAVTGWLLAVDADLTRTPGPLGDVRNFAIGAEAHLVRRVFARAGFRTNTIGDQPAGRTPVFSVGGSYVAFGSLLVDGQVTTGSEGGGTGWGVAARVVF